MGVDKLICTYAGMGRGPQNVRGATEEGPFWDNTHLVTLRKQSSALKFNIVLIAALHKIWPTDVYSKPIYSGGKSVYFVSPTSAFLLFRIFWGNGEDSPN